MSEADNERAEIAEIAEIEGRGRGIQEPLRSKVRRIIEQLRGESPELFARTGPEQTEVLTNLTEALLRQEEEEAAARIGEESFALWRRLAGQARRSLRFAFEEADRTGARMVSPEHLLLGLLFDDETVASQLIVRMGKSVAEIRGELQRQIAWEDFHYDREIPLGAQTKQVIDRAYEEARQLNDQYIGTEHLLIGLMREGTTVAAHVLFLCEVTADQTRVTLLKWRDEQEQQQAETGQAVSREGQEPQRTLPLLREPRYGDRGVATNRSDRPHIEICQDSATYLELVAAYRARDAHGYRHLVQGHQTLFLAPVGTMLKRLVPPPDSDEAAQEGGYYVRVLEGDYEGYAGWIFAETFARTGPDEEPFPPSLEG